MAFRRHLNSHVVANLNESCLFSRAHPAEQPGTRILPVPAHGDGGDTQSRSHFAIRVTAEITHFDHSRRPRLQPLQFPQRLIECQQIDAASFNPHAYRIQVFPDLAGAALLCVIPASKVNQDAAHLLAGDGEEMSPALYFARFATGQPQVSLMNQGRSLKDVIWPLALHLPGSNAVKFRIDQAGGLFGGILVPPLHSVQQQGELRWGARRRLLLLALKHLATVYSHAKEKGIPAEG